MQLGRQMNGWIDGRMDGWTNEWGGSTDGGRVLKVDLMIGQPGNDSGNLGYL